MISTDAELARQLAARATLAPGLPVPVATPTFTGHLSRHLVRLRWTGSPLPPEFAASALADFMPGPRPAAPARLRRLSLPVILARLTTCRACPLWSEPDARCASVRCSCSRRHLWHPADRCPEAKWP